ncbi:MAG: hypothetical protein V8S34_00765 [Lawsonibacter sp.]
MGAVRGTAAALAVTGLLSAARPAGAGAGRPRGTGRPPWAGRTPLPARRRPSPRENGKGGERCGC